MNQILRSTSLAWLALVVLSAAWIVLAGGRRINWIEQTSGQAPTATEDATSPTGYARGTRGLLLPVGSSASQARIMDVQKMVAAGLWRAAPVEYDNAPEGRPVHGAAPYRWWLRLCALGTGAGGGVAVERAALWADPALHALLCLVSGLLIAWRFGVVAGGLLALGIAALLAHAQVFAPGQPDDHGLFLAANLTGLLFLLAGFHDGTERGVRVWLTLAGAAGGFGLWLDAGSQLAVLGALWVGALATLGPTKKGVHPGLPWRHWAAGGAAVAIASWLIEGRPGGVTGLNLNVNHPLLALAWLGAAELLSRLQVWRRGEARRADWIAFAAGAVAIVAPLIWLYFHGGAGGTDFGPDHPSLAGRGGLIGWFQSGGISLSLVAALLPVMLVPAAWYLMARQPAWRPALCFALVGLVVVLALGTWQLRWWGLVDVMLLGLLAVVAAATPGGFAALGWRSGLGLVLLPGLVAAWPQATSDETLAPAEARALVERDLAHWLAARGETGVIALGPPALSGSLCYYGGLRVVASPFPGNEDGLALAARIAGTASVDEVQALFQRRGIQYLVLPSWDEALDRLAQLGAEKPERSFVALLRQWLPPRWLRPVAYQLPVIPGLEKDSLAVFEVVEPQENAVALSRLAEYFVETGRLDLAAAVGDSLEQAFGADAGAMIARAQVALARGEARTLARIVPELLPAVAEGRDEDLPWERRANLAIVLAQLKHADLARPQVKFCLGEADAERLRSLGPVSLLRLLKLARAFRLEFSDPGMRATALALLPPEFQAQLQP